MIKKGVSVLSKERLTIYGGNGEHYESINPIDTPYEYGEINLQKLIDKLAEYEDLEEQNLLLRLPCKVGDTVWEIVDECEGDSAGCYGTCDACHNRRLGIKETKFTIDMTDEVGNWFFLTKSEAEEKLRELEGK